MTKLIALLLALLVPLQFAWGAAATYCEHERAPQSGAHFGHHAHEHQGSTDSSAQGKLSVDNDCSFCHAGAPALVTPALHALGSVPRERLQEALATACSSALAEGPDRPQWPRLA
ncbi:MAG TPA: cobalt-zinc-cadmium resistance protein [Ideonella sp.]|uniref:cation efflux protein, CzcI family n=1 Tax=Ideonella sp. TaxID=1929293 RepID=UPI002B8B0F9E|nr:cation efflux protein, CzcI family [Ideonella sp.]HSI48880.1 cobalt-zinc-cadmium resistance protein [Ideonella sp.]